MGLKRVSFYFYFDVCTFYVCATIRILHVQNVAPIFHPRVTPYIAALCCTTVCFTTEILLIIIFY